MKPKRADDMTLGPRADAAPCGGPRRVGLPDRLSALAELVTRAGPERPLLPVHAPFTGDRIGAVPACTEADVHEALARARRAQPAWAARSVAERRDVFLRYHDRLLAWQDPLLDLMQLECGKARRHALEEVLDVALNCRHYAYRAARYLRTRRRRGLLPGVTAAWEHRHPVGVVGLIAPWNYPLTLAISDAVPALLAGNAVVLKPAEETSFTALLAVQMLREAGLPEDVFQVVTGRGPELGPALIAGVDFIGFTGSTETGRIVARQAGEHLIKSAMELGGKNPMLVLDDADLRWTVEGAVRACFTNAGQLCISTERLYVQRGIYDRFLAAFTARTRALRLGTAFSYDVEMGSLLSADQLAKVEAHVADAVARGATVLTGGRARPDLGPFFYEPTLLAGVRPGMTAYAEETFGPVVAVYRFDDEAEAVRAANDSPYGLNASVWTRDTRRGRRLARQIQCGTVNVNEAYAAAWGSIDAPMGGMKDSGLGRRHGREGFLKYTEAQTVAVQRFLPVGPPAGWSMAHYARLLTGAVRLLRHIPGLR